ncbi:MAG: DUF4118 domain-containing protein [Rhodocyclales bacterium]|nr:DUF4118 domain-containing protein [Rhodocyclales bacterium]
MPASKFNRGHAIAVALCALTTLAALPLRDWLDQANIVMLFLLAVFLVAIRRGRGPALLAAFLSVGLFDVFFVPPYYSFSVADAQYLVTFAVMLAIGLITTHLTAQLAERREAAQARERETRALYELARDLGATLTLGQAAEVFDRHFASLGLKSRLLVAESLDQAAELTAYGLLRLGPADLALARCAYDGKRVFEDYAIVCLPFAGVTRLRGVLVVAPADRAKSLPSGLLDATASLAGITVERIHYTEVAQRSEVDIRTEKLRSSILSSISHDLRTPLTSLVGLADTLTDPGQAGNTAERAAIIRDQAHAMHRMVTNLLDMARLQAGGVVLNLQWQPFEDIVDSSTRLLADILAQRRLVVDLPADLPLLRFDAVLLERVLCNLLENAVKYSEPGATITLAAAVRDGHFEVKVANVGAGFPAGRLEEVFDIFVRGAQEPAAAGTGIGLAVCKAIVAAHGGSIVAENEPGIARVRFVLPLGTPPGVEGEPA